MKLKRLVGPHLLTTTIFTALICFASELRAVSRVAGPEITWQQPSYTFTYTSPICRNTSGNLPMTLSGTPNGSFYTASPASLPINQGTGEIFPNNGTPAGNYTITYNGSGAQAVVVIPPSGNASISPATINLCQGNSVTLFATLSGPGLSAVGFTWNTGANVFNIQVSPNVSTNYTVNIRDNYGCTYNVSRYVNVVSLPANLSTTSPSVCAGQSTIVSVTGGTQPGMSYIWQPGGNVGQNISVSPPATQVYTVTVGQSGCTKTLTAKVTVSTAVTPTVDFNYPVPICTDSGDPLPFLSEGFTTGGTFFSDDPTFPIDPVTGKISLGNLQGGQYSISYSLTQLGCRAETVSPPTVLDLTQATRIDVGPSQQIVEGEGVIISASGPGGYLWEPGDGLNCTDCPSPYAAPSKTTRYCVSDPDNGCNQGGCLTVEVVCVNNGDMSVPNAFTPNRDGRNDKLCLQGWTYCVTGFQIKIFNRWGQEVFASNNSEFCWDGTFDGQDLPAGVYIYSIEANVNREKYSKNGNITIIR